MPISQINNEEHNENIVILTYNAPIVTGKQIGRAHV